MPGLRDSRWRSVPRLSRAASGLLILELLAAAACVALPSLGLTTLPSDAFVAVVHRTAAAHAKRTPRTTRAACQPGERWVQRWGKKLGGQYAIITAFVHHETRRLRFDVHLTSKCLRFSLVCTHQAMLEPACGDDDRLLVEMVKGIAMGLEVSARPIGGLTRRSKRMRRVC